MAIVYTPTQILERGLSLAGMSEARQRRQKRSSSINDFKAIYGIHPVVVADVWVDLQTTTIASAKIDTTKRWVHLKNFLRTLYFVRAYPTETQMKVQFGNTEKTIRRFVWYFLHRVQELKALKVVWPDDHEWVTNFIISVDGIRLQFHEVKHPTLSKDPDFYDFKSNGPGMSYELALHLFKPRLVWMKWNPKTNMNDRACFTEPGGLRDKIPAGKKAITDRGYRGRGGDTKVAHPNGNDSKELRDFKARGRMRQENFNQRITRFNCLNTARFHHGVQRHQTCFESICVLCCYEMELISPLFDI